METQTQTLTRKRGGAKYAGGHVILLILSTLLLTLAAVLLIMELNLFGILALIAGMLLRFLDTRI